MIERLRVLAPGLLAAIAVAAVARIVASFLPPALSEVLVAVLFGIVVANSGLLPSSATPGLRQLRSIGPRAFHVGFGTALAIAVISLAAL